MKVKVLKLGYAAREVEINQGATVEETVRASGMDGGGYRVTVNGVGADLSALIRENDVICLVPKVEGGSEQRSPSCY